jgi:hypothetical protein
MVRPATGSKGRRRWPVLFITAAALSPLAYALYTGQIWEDYFITFRYSQNLCDGLGPVYNAGERVHGFTSPLGMLLPALAYLMTGRTSYVVALWVFRLISIAAYIGGGLFIWRALRDSPGGRLSATAFAILYIIEAKSVAFTANGMETGFLLFFLGWTVSLVSCGPDPWLPRGLAWAGLMWTRPDGCVYIAALAIGELLLGGAGRKSLLLSFFKSATVTTLVYAPWLAWAWWYYGSPIPQTLLAKAPAQTMSVLETLRTMVGRLPERAKSIFAPMYYPMLWDAPAWIGWFCGTLSLVAGMYWMVPAAAADRRARVASFSFAVLGLYFSFMDITFPWYLPPAAICGLLVISSVIGRIGQMNTRLGVMAARSALFAVGATGLYLLVMTAYMMRVQQSEIEWGTRAAIGFWLRDRVGSGESVYLEPIGYIGYFSGAHILDYPGLITPRVVELRHQERLTSASLIDRLRPTWTVFRWPEQAQASAGGSLIFSKEYIPVKEFSAARNLARYSWLPGLGFLGFDTGYIISKRLPDPSAQGLSAELQEEATAYNHLRYPMMRTPPLLVRSQRGYDQANFGGQLALYVQPKGSVTFRVPKGAKHVAGRFGVLPPRRGDVGSFQFEVEFFPIAGNSRLLFKRQLEPDRTLSDHGLQDFGVDLPGSEGTLVLWTRTGLGPKPGSGWPCWTEVEVK